VGRSTGNVPDTIAGMTEHPMAFRNAETVINEHSSEWRRQRISG